MNLYSEFFLYATVFRLAIISAGTVSIVLGYRLFVGGILGDDSSKGAAFAAKAAGLEFGLKRAAPGTFFALFGVIIISVMLVQGNPELTLKSLGEAQRAGGSQDSSELTVRGGEPAAPGKFDGAVRKGLEYDRQGDIPNAVASYEEALTVMAMPMNQLAWDDLQEGKTEEALPLARLAVQLCPGKASCLDTLAEILFKKGERDEAVKWMGNAAALDPKYQARLTEFQRATKQ